MTPGKVPRFHGHSGAAGEQMPAGMIVTVPLIIMALTFQCWIFKASWPVLVSERCILEFRILAATALPRAD